MAQPLPERARPGVVDFATDRESGLPVGTQLLWRIRGMVLTGVLRPDDRLPSVRELAAFSGVNVNTARATYAALEQEGVLKTEHGRGTFVSPAAAELPGLRGIAAAAAEAAEAEGIGPEELLAGVLAATSVRPRDRPSPGDGSELEQARLRRALRAQIAGLERELGAYAWDDRRGGGGRHGGQGLGAVADAESLERVRDELVDRLRALRRDAEARGDAQEAARLRRAAMLADPAGHPWEVVSAAEAGEADGGEWHVVPRFGPLGAIMGWWRVREARTEPAGEGADGPSGG